MTGKSFETNTRSEASYRINSTRWNIFLDRSQAVNHNINISLPMV